MKGSLSTSYNLNNAELLSIVDDMPLWSAPFGLRLLDVVRYRKNIQVLDVGTGLGFPLIELAMRLGSSCRLFGLDPWKAGLDRTRLKIKYTGIANVELVEGVAEAMPFEKGQFDLIISNNGLNNVQDLQRALLECARVAKSGAQMVCTFNTDRTFHEFYSLLKRSLRVHGLDSCIPTVDEHISSKRKPVAEYRSTMRKAGWNIQNVFKDKFSYRFSDGTSMLHHFSMQLSFLPSWKELVPASRRKEVFSEVETLMNNGMKKERAFTMSVPFVTMDCWKK
jgi:arsenite methyltransferase